MIISYMHHCFYNSQVLLANAFAIRTTVTTVGVGDGGSTRKSTKLKDETRNNCRMTDEEFHVFAHLPLELNSINNGTCTGLEVHKQNDHLFPNMLLSNFTTITNLNPKILKDIKED